MTGGILIFTGRAGDPPKKSPAIALGPLPTFDVRLGPGGGYATARITF